MINIFLYNYCWTRLS